jgi:hypothetical protein
MKMADRNPKLPDYLADREAWEQRHAQREEAGVLREVTARMAEAIDRDIVRLLTEPPPIRVPPAGSVIRWTRYAVHARTTQVFHGRSIADVLIEDPTNTLPISSNAQHAPSSTAPKSSREGP